MTVGGDDGIWKGVSAETTCRQEEEEEAWRHSGWREKPGFLVARETFKRSFSPEPVSDLHVVVPAQVTPEHVHGGKIQDNLRDVR